MVEEAFRNSKLVMASAGDVQITAPAWSDMPLNALLCGISVLLGILALYSLISLRSAMGGCLRHWRGCVELEHNIHNTNDRNLAALVLALPFCLIADRYSLYRPDFLSFAGPGWHSAATVGAFLAFLIVHKVSGLAARLPNCNSDFKAAAHKTPRTFFIIYTLLMLATAGVMRALNAPESALRTVLYVELAVGYAFALLRIGQIIAARHSFLPTILYLCALELLPVALLIVSAVLF